MSVLSLLQSGQGTLSNSLTLVNKTITSVDITKSILWFDTAIVSGNNRPDSEFVTGQLTSATNVQFQRIGGQPVDVYTPFYVTAFSSGVAAQRGSTLVTTSIKVTISPVDPATSFPLCSVRNAGTAVGAEDCVAAKISLSSTLHLYNGGVTPPFVEWQVIDYDHCSVQTGQTSLTTGALTATVSLSVTADPAKTIVLLGRRFTTGNPVANQFSVKAELNSTGTALTFSRYGDGYSLDVRWHVVTFTDSTFVNSQLCSFASLVQTLTFTMTNSVSLDHAIVIDGSQGHHAGRDGHFADDGVSRSSFKGSIAGTTLVVIERFNSGQAADAPWYVINFREGTTHTGTLADTVTLAETLTATATLSAPVSETVTVADAVTVSATLTADFTENVALAEDPEGGFTFSATYTDTVVLTDTYTGGLFHDTSLAETLLVGDAIEIEPGLVGRRPKKMNRSRYAMWPEPVASPTLKPFAPPDIRPPKDLKEFLSLIPPVRNTRSAAPEEPVDISAALNDIRRRQASSGPTRRDVVVSRLIAGLMSESDED